MPFPGARDHAGPDGMSASSALQRRAAGLDRRLKVVSAALLAVAMVLSAWSTYQAHRWGGRQLDALTNAAADRVRSASQAGLARQMMQVDVGMFLQWVTAYARGDARETAFLEGRFRPELKRAVEAWIATRPLENPSAPPLPFGMPEYRLATQAESDRLAALAEQEQEAAAAYNRNGDDFVLLTVLFASVLFFGSLAPMFDDRGLRFWMLGIGLGLLLLGGILLARTPVA